MMIQSITDITLTIKTIKNMEEEYIKIPKNSKYFLSCIDDNKKLAWIYSEADKDAVEANMRLPEYISLDGFLAGFRII